MEPSGYMPDSAGRKLQWQTVQVTVEVTPVKNMCIAAMHKKRYNAKLAAVNLPGSYQASMSPWLASTIFKNKNVMPFFK